MGSSQGKREAGIGSDLRDGVVDLIVQAAKMRHEMNLGADALKAWRASRGVSGEPVRLANLSFDLAELGVRGWRDLLATQRRYEPEMAAAWSMPGVPWLDPTAELRSNEALLKFSAVRYNTESAFHILEDVKQQLTLENRSHGYVDLVLPRTLELVRADGLDRVVVAVAVSPAAPILGPGDDVALTITLGTKNQVIQGSDSTSVYYGTLKVGSRGGICTGVPVALEVSKAT